jgi:multicomponent Na+:H+ antiporter subunit A
VVAFLLLLHALVAAAMPSAVVRLGRWAFLLGALAPASAVVWAGFQAPRVLAGGAVRETVAWAPLLGLELSFRLDALALAMVTLVSGIGSLVLVYCAWYFHSGERHLGRAAAVLVAFAGAMFGLVLADNLLILYVFWELTTVCSFVLIGHDDTDDVSRRAAMQALLVTTGFGLLMLLGFVLLGTASGTYAMSALLAEPPQGGLVPVALLLVLAGAFAKSAQVPLHSWLPAAMVAPTPVSAYLHAAAMVKAGVYLIARLAPGFADVPPWRPVLLTVGVASLLVGGWRALRQDDLKRLLAFGTVSQLGLLIVLVGVGTRLAAIAGLAMLLAHGLFKAALFLAVGVLDHQAGSRRASVLSGVGRRMPVLFMATALAVLSMAGLPPTLGYVSKEAALEAFLHGGAGELLVLGGVVAGSALTVAYSARLLWGGFADKPGQPESDVTPAPFGFLSPVVVLAGAGILAGFATGWALAEPYVDAFGDAPPYELGLWHGVTTALSLSVLIVLGGVGLHAVREHVARVQSAVSGMAVPDAERAYEQTLGGVHRLALFVTGRIQVGSLPVYLVIILVALLVIPGGALAAALPELIAGGDRTQPEPRLWDNPMQAVLAVIVLVSALGAARAHRRFTAVLLVAAAGFGVGGLFVVHGAPDVALTHFLVETLLLIMLVLVLRQLPANFSEASRPGNPPAVAAAVLAGLVGAFVSCFLLVVSGTEQRATVAEGYIERAPEAGGTNVVNTILVDFRALDTLGEITVLAVTATGVVSLILLAGGTTGRPANRAVRAGDGDPAQPAHRSTGPAEPRDPLLATTARPPLGPRSLLLEMLVRVLTPAVLVFSVYLLLVGHDRVGGGFAAGLVAGMAYVLRYVAGGWPELRAAVPVQPTLFVGGGLLLAAATGAAGWVMGDALLHSATVEIGLPVVGHLKLTSTLLFDAGVYLLVLGLVLVLLTALGAQPEPEAEEEEAAV